LLQKHGKHIYYVLKNTQLSAFFRKEIIEEIYLDFLITTSSIKIRKSSQFSESEEENLTNVSFNSISEKTKL